jgi:hypothetical protein
MNEHDALIVTAVRAVESSDRSRELWSDNDRAWASRAAAEVVGEAAPPDAFVARRAALAYERLSSRYAPLRRAVHAVRWRGWIGPAVAVAAFVAGLVVDRVGSGQRINLLAPPVLALVAWNLAVYVALALGPLFGARDHLQRPLRRLVVALAGRLERLPRVSSGKPIGAAIAAFASDWSSRGAPLYYARAARILHVAAAMLAAGVIAGLYLRGIALEYRATWESTFLDAATVQRLLSWLLWPGSIVTGIAVPSIADLEAIRSGAAPASANAANWLHLITATVAVVVIVPRLILAAFAFALERHRAARLALGLDEPYFQRLLRGFRGERSQITVVPYSYRVPDPSLHGLQTIVARVFGGSARLVVASPVAYGDENVDRPVVGAAGTTIALFNLAATPEREAHAAFVAHLARGAATLLVLVDESPFRERAGGDAKRLDERRASWRESLGEPVPLFVDLASPDLPAIERAIEARLEPVAS